MKYKVTLNGKTYEIEVEAGKAMCLAEYEAYAPAAAPVAAGESVTVDVTITLADGLKNFYDIFFPNGTFVEGYVVFNEYYEGQQYSSAHATFMTYYGDWTQAPIFEKTDFTDLPLISGERKKRFEIQPYRRSPLWKPHASMRRI